MVSCQFSNGDEPKDSLSFVSVKAYQPNSIIGDLTTSIKVDSKDSESCVVAADKYWGIACNYNSSSLIAMHSF